MRPPIGISDVEANLHLHGDTGAGMGPLPQAGV